MFLRPWQRSYALQIWERKDLWGGDALGRRWKNFRVLISAQEIPHPSVTICFSLPTSLFQIAATSCNRLIRTSSTVGCRPVWATCSKPVRATCCTVALTDLLQVCQDGSVAAAYSDPCQCGTQWQGKRKRWRRHKFIDSCWHIWRAGEIWCWHHTSKPQAAVKLF